MASGSDIFHDVLLSYPPCMGSCVDADCQLLLQVLRALDLSSIRQDAIATIYAQKKLTANDISQEGYLSLLWPEDTATNVLVGQKKSLNVSFCEGDVAQRVRLVVRELIRISTLHKHKQIVCSTTDTPNANVSNASKSTPGKGKNAAQWEWRIFTSDIFSSTSTIHILSQILTFASAELKDVLSLEELCLSIMHTPHGLFLLRDVLTRHPQQILTVCVFLMNQCTGDDAADAASIFFSRVLRGICQWFPHYTGEILQMLTNQQRFLCLIMATTLRRGQESGTMDQDVLDLFQKLLTSFNGVADGSGGPAGAFRLKCLVNCSRTAVFEACRAQLLVHACRLLPPSTASSTSPRSPPPIDLDLDLSGIISLVKIYIYLKEMPTQLYLSVEENRLIRRLLMCRPQGLSVLSNQYIILTLCAFTLLPDLFADTLAEVELVEWIKWQLAVDVQALDRVIPEGGTHLEIFLLLASHLRAAHYKDVSVILTEHLGIKVAIKANNVARLKNLLNNEVFKEEALLRHTLRVPATHNLTSSLTGALPINCIHSLLQNKSYSVSYSQPIKEWILTQVRKCSVPLHPVMLQVLALQIERTLPTIRRSTGEGIAEEYVSLQKAFTAEEICAVVYDISPVPNKRALRMLRPAQLFCQVAARHDNAASHCPSILMVYYVLAFKVFYQQHLKTFLMAKSDIGTYGLDLMEKIPFQYYLNLTEKYSTLYDPLHDILNRLMVQILPQMRTLNQAGESLFPNDASISRRDANFCMPLRLDRMQDLTEEDFEEISVDDLARFLDVLCECPPSSLSLLLDVFVRLVPRICSLAEELPSSTQDAFEKVWMQLANIDPNTLLLATARCFLSLNGEKESQALTFENLCIEPLHILRCHPLVFRKGFLTRILLRTFAFFLKASDNYLTQELERAELELMLKQGADKMDVGREEQKRAMFMLQESLAVQILIEHCLPTSFHPPPTSVEDISCFQLPEDLTNSQKAICGYIHHLILNNPTLAKLIVFQSFPIATVATIVRGVESLHICFDYLHEAMALPSVPKKLFVLELTSCLCLRFRLARSMAVARLAVDVIATLLTAYPAQLRQLCIIQTAARCLARFANIFPPLRQDCLQLLRQILAAHQAEQYCLTAVRKARLLAQTLFSADSNGTNASHTSLLLRQAINCAAGLAPLRR